MLPKTTVVTLISPKSVKTLAKDASSAAERLLIRVIRLDANDLNPLWFLLGYHWPLGACREMAAIQIDLHLITMI